MAQNPLQQFFRQPKIFIDLPSKGIYNKAGTIQGDATNMPIYGMTAMDEIIMKTPDALLSGDSTVKVLESCCPSIKNGWDLSTLDVDVLLIAIRIATYGEGMPIEHTCDKCGNSNTYEISLTGMIDYYSKCQFDNKLVLKDFSIKLQPLTYQQSTGFAIRNFKIQQQAAQVQTIVDKDEVEKAMAALYSDLAILQNEIFIATVESVDTGNVVVTEREYINEFLLNADKSIFDAIRSHTEKNKETWSPPAMPIKCDSCGADHDIKVEMDQASFFG
jgi:hypothetical protein